MFLGRFVLVPHPCSENSIGSTDPDRVEVEFIVGFPLLLVTVHKSFSRGVLSVKIVWHPNAAPDHSFFCPLSLWSANQWINYNLPLINLTPHKYLLSTRSAKPSQQTKPKQPSIRKVYIKPSWCLHIQFLFRIPRAFIFDYPTLFARILILLYFLLMVTLAWMLLERMEEKFSVITMIITLASWLDSMRWQLLCLAFVFYHNFDSPHIIRSYWSVKTSFPFLPERRSSLYTKDWQSQQEFLPKDNERHRKYTIYVIKIGTKLNQLGKWVSVQHSEKFEGRKEAENINSPSVGAIQLKPSTWFEVPQ